MTSLRREILLKTFKLSDLLIMACSFAMATWAVAYQYSGISFTQFFSMRIKVQNFALFFVFLLIWHIIFSLLRLYHSRRLSTHWSEVIDVIKATSLGTIAILIIGLWFRIDVVTPTFLAVFWVAGSAITILCRFTLRYALARIRVRGRNLRNILIVGTNPRAVRFARNIQSKPELGYCVVGFVDNGRSRNQEFRRTGYPLVTDFTRLPAFLRENVVDEVMICLPVKSFYDQISKIVEQCEEQGIIVRFLSDFFNLKIGRSKAEKVEGNEVITIQTGAMQGFAVLIKRFLDMSVSLILLILLSPLFFVTALLIKITSPGSTFFVQERVGFNRRRFRLYKFRTMIADAEQKLSELEHLNEVSGPAFKIKDDPRITWIGRFLRRTSIDELPQLINVLKGDMSLVGPRPLPARDYNGFDRDWHRRRFSVRPGITCLWQVNGRHNIPFEKWMELDLEYIDQWSLLLDLSILIRTIPAVLKGSGAS